MPNNEKKSQTRHLWQPCKNCKIDQFGKHCGNCRYGEKNTRSYQTNKLIYHVLKPPCRILKKHITDNGNGKIIVTSPCSGVERVYNRISYITGKELLK